MNVYVNGKTNQFMKVLPADPSILQSSKEFWEESDFHFIDGSASHFGELTTQQIVDLFQVFKHLSFSQKMKLCNKIRVHHGLKPVKTQDEFDEYLNHHKDDSTELKTEDENDEAIVKDFLTEMETGDEVIINDFPSSFSLLDWSDIEDIVFDYFNDTFKDTKWHVWYVPGFVQGELAYVWYYDFTDEEPINASEKFKDDYQSDFDGETFTDIFQNILYGTAVTILPCDSTGSSNVDDWCNSRHVAGLTTDNEFLDEYMSKAYHMVPAKESVHYYA